MHTNTYMSKHGNEYNHSSISNSITYSVKLYCAQELHKPLSILGLFCSLQYPVVAPALILEANNHICYMHVCDRIV